MSKVDMLGTGGKEVIRGHLTVATLIATNFLSHSCLHVNCSFQMRI